MRAFLIPVGTDIKVSKKYKPWNSADSFLITKTKKEVMYFIEDIRIDPIKPDYPSTVGYDYAKAGYYGFQLPENSSGFDVLLVHASNVIVG